MSPKTDARTRILAAALDLFHAEGVSAVGVDRILKASGTGKSQFYHYFESKDDLVLHVLRHHRASIESGTGPLKRRLATWKDLEDWFAFFVSALEAMGFERSCPIGTIAGELGGRSGPLRDEAHAIFEAARAPLVELFAALRRAGKLKRSADPQALADLCYVVMQGGLLVGKVERSSAPFRNAVQQTMAYLRSLRP